jgi:hypothetical protein
LRAKSKLDVAFFPSVRNILPDPSSTSILPYGQVRKEQGGAAGAPSANAGNLNASRTRQD